MQLQYFLRTIAGGWGSDILLISGDSDQSDMKSRQVCCTRPRQVRTATRIKEQELGAAKLSVPKKRDRRENTAFSNCKVQTCKFCCRNYSKITRKSQPQKKSQP